MPHDTLVLTARDVATALDLDACIAAVERALDLHARGRSAGPASLGLPAPDGTFHVKAAGLTTGSGAFIVAKANCNLPGNPSRRGLPTIQGVLTLFDAETGVPLAVMDSIVITSVRTGAVGGIAIKHLARADATVVTVAGCGEQGAIQLRAAAAVRRVAHVWAHDLESEKARRFASRMTRALGVPVEATVDLAGAIARSEICITCTTARTPIVAHESAHPGLLVVGIGADNPGKQELEPRLLAQSTVVVDSLDACAASGDLHHAIASGAMTRDDVHAELSAVVAGQAPGRTRDDDVFVFDSAGTAIQDAAAAVLVYSRAQASGLGLTVPLGRL